MNDLGRIAGGLASGVAQGIGIGQVLDQQRGLADERAWGGEIKQQQRKAWQTADLDRARAEATNALQGFLTAKQQGLDVDPSPVRDALSKVGVDLRKYTDPAMKSWLRNGFSALKTQQITPETVESFNWRFAEDLNKTRGKTYENDVTLPDGSVLPKGSKIIDTKAVGVLPSASNQGLFLDLEVTAETPDGKRVSYNAPATKNRSSDPDDEVLEIPLDRLVDVMGDDLRRLEMFEQSPEMMSALTSQLYAMGGSLPTQKFGTITVQEGVDLVTYQVDAQGRPVKKLGRGPKFAPEKPDKGTDDQREYELAKREGFKGSFVDYLQAKKGQGITYTDKDGNTIQIGGAAGGGKPPTGFRWKSDGTALEPIPGGPEDPKTPKKPGAEVQRMNIALEALDGGLDSYEKALQSFNARSFDQLSPTQRAEIASLVADIRLQFKEAQALGALTGPDIGILDQLLSDPASMKGFIYGNDGLLAQLKQARQSVARRKDATSKVTGTGDSDAQQRTVRRTGKLPDGRKVIQYSDGMTEVQ